MEYSRLSGPTGVFCFLILLGRTSPWQGVWAATTPAGEEVEWRPPMLYVDPSGHRVPAVVEIFSKTVAKYSHASAQRGARGAHVSPHARAHACACAHACAYAHACARAHSHAHACACAHAHTHTHACAYARARAHACACAHAHAQAHAHTHTPPPPDTMFVDQCPKYPKWLLNSCFFFLNTWKASKLQKTYTNYIRIVWDMSTHEKHPIWWYCL